jgi:hypothetical protein
MAAPNEEQGMQTQITPALMTIRDMTLWSRVGRTRIYEEINRGALPMFKIGRRSYIRREDAECWLAAQLTAGGRS